MLTWFRSGPPSPVGPTSRIATTGAFDGNRMEGGNDRAMAYARRSRFGYPIRPTRY